MNEQTTMIDTTPARDAPVRKQSSMHIILGVLIIYVLIAFFSIWTAAAQTNERAMAAKHTVLDVAEAAGLY